MTFFSSDFKIQRTAAAAAIAVLILAGACSVEISQTSTVPTSAPPTQTDTPEPTATPLPPTDTPEPTATQPGDDLTPTPTASPTPTELPFDFPAVDGFTLDAEILSGWEALSLGGKLTFLTYSESGQAIVVFDLATGELYPVFVGPENTWVLAASLRADHADMVMAYAPVPEGGVSQTGYSDLYLLPAGGGAPSPLLERTDEVEAFFGSVYDPSGASVFYSWFFTDPSVDYGFRYHINRIDLATGEISVVVEDAFWQNVSRDGASLAYVTFDPNAGADDPAELRVMDLATGEAAAVLDTAEFPTVDAPFFSPDSSFLYFSAVSNPPVSLTWFDRLTGVRSASAHNVPSDWFRVNLETAETERITEIYDQGMFGVFSPDGETIAFISATGLWVMGPDGSGLIQVIESASFYGNLEWVP